MRLIFKTALGVFLSTTMLASCSDENMWSGSSDQGGVALLVSADGRLMKSTRADDGVSPIVPNVSEMGITMTKANGEGSKHWANVDLFNKEKGFDMGNYTLTASYGNIDQEGFENPYFTGSTEVNVIPGTSTEAQIVATLANAMVSVRYTDEFCNNFESYSAAIQTEGHDWLVFAKDESRPAYVSPSETVKLNITLTDTQGRKVTIQPAEFEAQARHHYIVTIGVSGTSVAGNLTLDVQFDEDVINETVEVSLGEDLFTAPAPEVKAMNFEVTEPINKIEYEDINSNPEFHVFAFGGLKNATLNIISQNGYAPAFGKSVNLVGVDDVTVKQLESEGIGNYFRNVDKMGVLNVKKFVEQLPTGNYEIQLQVSDMMTRVSEPLTLSVAVTPLSISIAPAVQADFMASAITVDLTTNSENIKNAVIFKVPDAKNNMVETTIASVEELTSETGTRSEGMHVYRYTLPIESYARSSIDVQMSLAKKKSITVSTTIPVAEPEYTITPDAFSKHVVLKIESENAAVLQALLKNLKFYNGTSLIPNSNISIDDKNNLITVSGLTPSIQYLALKAVCVDFEKTVPEFTTESAMAIPNGDFSAATETININPINTGGAFKIRFLVTSTSQLKSSIVCSTPDGWANLNPLTCNINSREMNTWYVVPSTYCENDAVVIRSVGYNHDGKVLSAPTTTATYYSTTTPGEDGLNKASGELFLGSYSLDNRVDGIDWNSRPTTLSFDYSYLPVANTDEEGEVYMKIISSSGSVLAEKTDYLEAATTTVSKTIKFTSYPFGEKAVKIILGFKSTKSGVTPTIKIPVGSELKEDQINSINYLTGTPLITVNKYKALATGSILTIDNVRVGYDVPKVSNAASKRR